MVLWVFVSLVLVVGVKYYTATQIRGLEARLNRVKDGLQEKKNELHGVESKQKEVESEEDAFIERIRVMKEIIQDIHLRMSTRDEDEDTALVDAIPPPPGLI